MWRRTTISTLGIPSSASIAPRRRRQHTHASSIGSDVLRLDLIMGPLADSCGPARSTGDDEGPRLWALTMALTHMAGLGTCGTYLAACAYAAA